MVHPYSNIDVKVRPGPKPHMHGVTRTHSLTQIYVYYKIAHRFFLGMLVQA